MCIQQDKTGRRRIRSFRYRNTYLKLHNNQNPRSNIHIDMKGTQNQYLLLEVRIYFNLLSGLVYVHEVYTGTE